MGRWYRFTSGSWVAQDGASIGTSGDEYAYWQDKAALLDPDAYEFVIGTSLARTVDSGETWYLVNGWYLEVLESSGTNWFHRPLHVDHALALPAGTVLNTDNAQAGTFMYLCKPADVIAGDSRYTDDPKGLYFERLRRLNTLALNQVGNVRTDNGTTDVNFDNDFTNGMVVHVSSHDVAWTILEHSGGSGGMNTLNEISDTTPIRFAESVLCPFVRTTFPNIALRGASLASGTATVTYVKLPADW